MAYFGAPVSETVLEPVVTDVREYRELAYCGNGIEIRKGMTVGEYGDQIMQNIYGGEAVAVK